jgi:hypothetical protein
VSGSSKVFERIWHGQNPLIFMHFHAVLFGKQHESWSKQHNGKVTLESNMSHAAMSMAQL